MNDEEKKSNNYNGNIVGSLGYMASQIILQDKVNFCADYFALGVISFEMMMLFSILWKRFRRYKKIIMANQVQKKNFQFHMCGRPNQLILLILLYLFI